MPARRGRSVGKRTSRAPSCSSAPATSAGSISVTLNSPVETSTWATAERAAWRATAARKLFSRERTRVASMAGGVGIEVSQDILDEPAQAAVSTVDQRHQPGLGPSTARALAVTHVEFPEPAQLPQHVVQVQHPCFVDPQAHVGRESGDGIVPRHRGELAGGHQLLAPAGEELLDLLLGRWDP